MTDPYLIEGPALISFSGGRTSAYLLKHVLDTYGGTLPGNVIACFRQHRQGDAADARFRPRLRPGTGTSPVVWLEYDPAGESATEVPRRGPRGSASERQGEPYEALLRERKYLPNPVSHFCTTTLKIRVMRDYARSLGWEHWTNTVGLRADEGRRVARIRNDRERWETIAPLHAAGVTKEDVTAFWARPALRPRAGQHRRQDPGRKLRSLLPEIRQDHLGDYPDRPEPGRLVDQDGARGPAVEAARGPLPQGQAELSAMERRSTQVRCGFRRARRPGRMPLP